LVTKVVSWEESVWSTSRLWVWFNDFMAYRLRKKWIKFYPYVIQIGKIPEVVYVNYASNMDKAFRDFKRRHPQLKKALLRRDLSEGELSYADSKLADGACRRLIERLEAAGYEVIAGGPLHNRYWQVYVIEIDGDPNHLYVGETNYPVEKRFQQHVNKFNPARVLLKYDSFELAMQHAEGWPKVTTKEESLRNEAALAEELRSKGYKVEGGH